MDHSSRFLAYLEAYARKDLDAIARMLAPDATLRDWNLSVRGHRAVEAETLKNFEDAHSIEIQVLQTYERADGVAGELRIVVDGSVELFVVDVIEFDADGQVRAIRSYKGRGD